MTPSRIKPNESELTIQLTTGGTICLRGADNYDSLRGEGLDFVALDEYASMHQEAWFEVLRPALADRQGKALFIGTPNGLNHFHDLYQEARTHPEWAAFSSPPSKGATSSLQSWSPQPHNSMSDSTGRSFRPASRIWARVWSTTPLIAPSM